jgi:hypothetical protein
MIEYKITEGRNVSVYHGGTHITTVMNQNGPGITSGPDGIPVRPNVRAAVAEWALNKIQSNGGLTDKTTAVIVDLAGQRIEENDNV